MEYFSVHRNNAGEGYLATQSCSNTIKSTGNLSLCHALLHSHAHSCGMHLIANGCCTFQLCHFFRTLDVAELHHGINQRLTSCSALLIGMESSKIHELDHQIVAIRREEMHHSSLRFGLFKHTLQRTHRSCVCNAAFCCHVCHRRHRTSPNHIVNVDVIAHQGFSTAFAVYHKSQSITMLSREIEE